MGADPLAVHDPVQRGLAVHHVVIGCQRDTLDGDGMATLSNGGTQKSKKNSKRAIESLSSIANTFIMDKTFMGNYVSADLGNCY